MYFSKALAALCVTRCRSNAAYSWPKCQVSSQLSRDLQLLRHFNRAGSVSFHTHTKKKCGKFGTTFFFFFFLRRRHLSCLSVEGRADLNSAGIRRTTVALKGKTQRVTALSTTAEKGRLITDWTNTLCLFKQGKGFFF